MKLSQERKADIKEAVIKYKSARGTAAARTDRATMPVETGKACHQVHHLNKSHMPGDLLCRMRSSRCSERVSLKPATVPGPHQLFWYQKRMAV